MAPRDTEKDMSRCWCAEYASWHKPARMPGRLLAETDAPTPLPQSSTPRSARPTMIAQPTASA